MPTYDFPIPDFRTSTEPDALASLPIILDDDYDSSSFQLPDTNDENPFDAAEKEEVNGTDTMKEVTAKGVQVPTHPITSMQGPFAESMLEVSEASTPNVPKETTAGNSAKRRQILLDQNVSEETHASRWRQKPGQQFHELWKLMAQISFGIYLLLNGIARDDEQVMTILQGHVDEVDEFLETTLEDFDLAQDDIDERLKFLKLPLENIVIFDGMLEDRNFRLQIVNGNERIEHVITRTAKAMNDALKDVQQGLDACKEFTIYLAEEQEDAIWKEERPEMHKVFDAMKGNVEGWYKAYVSLQTKGNHLGVALVQLGSIVAEMDRRAGEVSRKTRFSISPRTTPIASPPASPPNNPHNSRQMRQSMLKDLPSDPNLITPAIRATLPAFQLVQDRERTPEPESGLEFDDSPDSEQPEPEFILKPRTYSPAPSPHPPSQQDPSPPEIRQRSSLRKRFSLKRKEAPPTSQPRQPPPSNDPYWGPRQHIQPTSSPRQREHEVSLSAPLQTPPSRGLDSAYCSDFEKPSPPQGIHPALIPISSHQSHTSRSTTTGPSPSPRIPPARLDSPPVLSGRDFMPSPRSDQQYFRPVNASPNSPLQRPWTAAPPGSPQSLQEQSRSRSHHLHHASNSSSNLRGLSHAHTPSSLRRERDFGDRTNAPSAMGMSVMSGMTQMTDVSMSVIGENGERERVKMRVKKKRSAFGWLKKQFSLSEEEKAAFEERRRAPVVQQGVGAGGGGYGYGYGGYERGRGRPEQRWVDGRRVR